MAHIEQGQDLQEAPIVGADGNIVQPSPPSGGGGPKFGPKQIAIAAAALVVLAMLAFMLLRGKPGGDEDTTHDASESSTSSDLDDPFFYPPEDNTSLGVPDGFLTSSPPPESSFDGNRTDLTNPYMYISYTEDEVKKLRGYGYTGDEIEYFAQVGYSVDQLISAAQKKMDEAYAEWRRSVLDAASPEYKELMEQTFLGNPATRGDVKREEIVIGHNVTENVDYEKIGVYNYQAWIKVHLSIGDIFMNIPVERYSAIPESGNIVVAFTTRCGVDDTIYEVTNLREVAV